MILLESTQIHKAQFVRGNTLVFRNADTTDANFILSLRSDIKKSKYLSSTSAQLSQQVAWLKDYSENVDQAYFIIETKEGKPIGTVRLYDAKFNSFCWGSWILKDGSPPTAAIESALMVYSYAVDHLGFSAAHFDVRKGNVSVWRFHERFGAVRVDETEMDYFYEIDTNKIIKARFRYKKYLSETVTVESD